jgi:hypothetical protein
LRIDQALVLERFFFLEYCIFKYLITSDNYQNHVDNNIFLHRCSRSYFFPEHHLSYILMRAIVDFMFNRIANETTINDGTKFVGFFVTSFVTRFISYTTTSLGQNSIHCYLVFVFNFVVWVLQIPMAKFLGLSWSIALTANHICSPSFASLLMPGWWF